MKIFKNRVSINCMQPASKLQVSLRDRKEEKREKAGVIIFPLLFSLSLSLSLGTKI